MRLPRSLPPFCCLLVACNEVAGIVATPCVPACVDAKTQLFCDDRGEPRTRVCPGSAMECAEPACVSGKCSFAPATEKACGRRGVCSDGFACIGRETRLSASQHHTCLAGEDGKVWCWGENANYELGDGTAEDRGSPVPVRDLPGEPIEISAGYTHTCALLRDGRIACWGGNDSGQCGAASSTAPLERPEIVPAPGVKFTALAAGRAHTCAVSSEGLVYCWGDTTYGQSGVDPALAASPIVAPTRVEGLDNVYGPAAVIIETVKDHTCALRSLRPHFVCWGSNVDDSGQIVHKLGPGAAGFTHSARPLGVDFEKPPQDVGMSAESTYAKTEQTGVSAWGLNTHRQLGLQSEEAAVSAPGVVLVQSPGIEPLVGVEFVLRSVGPGQCVSMFNATPRASSFLCWGENDHGEVGLGALPDGNVELPVAVRAPPPAARQLVRGEDHVCAIGNEDGREQVRCYGAEHLVGNGTTRNEDGATAIQLLGAPLRWNPDYVPVLLE
jgi:alpha-tubulin suppressor-like RCC1 family protein